MIYPPRIKLKGYETRKNDDETDKNISHDLHQVLLPFVNENKTKLRNFIPHEQ